MEEINESLLHKRRGRKEFMSFFFFFFFKEILSEKNKTKEVGGSSAQNWKSLWQAFIWGEVENFPMEPTGVSLGE